MHRDWNFGLESVHGIAGQRQVVARATIEVGRFVATLDEACETKVDIKVHSPVKACVREIAECAHCVRVIGARYDVPVARWKPFPDHYRLRKRHAGVRGAMEILMAECSSRELSHSTHADARCLCADAKIWFSDEPNFRHGTGRAWARARAWA